MFKFIHLTDTHQVRPGLTLYGLEPYERLQAAVASINREHVDAEFVMITGDLTHWGEAEAYACLRRALAPLTMPVRLLIGNHDDRSNFLREFSNTPIDSNGFVQYWFDSGPIRVVALDTNEPGVSWGAFCDRRASWLAGVLAEATAARRPVHLMLHHPPFPVGIDSMDRISLRDPEPLIEAIRPFKATVKHLYFGHVHRPISGCWQGIPFSTVRATNHQVALAIRAGEKKVPGSHEPPQYGVVLVNDEQTVVHLHDFADESPRFDL
jgi:Icc protein